MVDHSICSGFNEKAMRDSYDLDRHMLPKAEPVLRQTIVVNGDSSTLLEYWNILWCRKNTIFIIALLVMAAAVALTMRQPAVYQAHATLGIQGLNENFLNLRDIDPTASPANYASDSYLQTQIKLLQSEQLVRRVILKLRLRDSPVSTPGKPWWKFFRDNTSLPAGADEQLVSNLLDNLTVRAFGQTRIVEILYASSDPNTATDVVNTLCDEFIEYGHELRARSSQNTGEWLAEQLRDTKHGLEQSETQLQKYARTSGLLFAQKDNLSEMKLRQLQEELSKAQTERVNYQSRLEVASASPVDTVPDVLNDSTLREYRVRLTELRRQLAELTSTLTPAHYKVQRIQAQIAAVVTAFDRERTNIIGRLRNETDAVRQREFMLQAAYREQAKVVSDQAGKSVQYNVLNQEVETGRRIYESLLQKVRQAHMGAAMQASNIVVVDPAVPPTTRYKPNMQMNAALSLFGGTLFGVLLVLVRHRSDRSIHTPGVAPMYLNVSELGIIPFAHSADSIASRTLQLLSRSTPTAHHSLLSVPKNPRTSECLELITSDAHSSQITEAFRALATSLLFANSNGTTPRVIVITSPNQGDGKTTVASNLAIALAETDTKVLLVDGDLRRPRLHNVFGLSNDSGLSNVLQSVTPIQQMDLKGALLNTHVRGVDLLASGKESSSIPRLFHSSRLSALLQRLRCDYSIIVIDAPPLLSVADARVLSRASDGVVLVLRAGRTTWDTALAARHRLLEDGTPLIGTVLNNWKLKAYPSPSCDYGYSMYNTSTRSSIVR